MPLLLLCKFLKAIPVSGLLLGVLFGAIFITTLFLLIRTFIILLLLKTCGLLALNLGILTIFETCLMLKMLILFRKFLFPLLMITTNLSGSLRLLSFAPLKVLTGYLNLYQLCNLILVVQIFRIQQKEFCRLCGRRKTCPPRVQVFAWRLLRKSLATAYIVAARSAHVHPECYICGKIKDDFHLFFSCDFARVVWFIAPMDIRVQSF